MPVLTLKPLSCKVQDFINAWKAANGSGLFPIHPQTGKRISDILPDIPNIGLSAKKTPEHREMGFIGSPDDETPNDQEATYEIQALLNLKVDPEKLPPELKEISGPFWLL
ncbi:hypothetical protein A3K29_05275 [Candidatus Collierbacteria bacterium RIFOXYB2_FULL_46_14]|uniref:Uncharacterized protein n=1 Tax=Candidatus Collierbacteria bacterium GW2011_GWA2_46_26 TaxID=1618381 RepID=A0A0G1PKR9_9BACT|nr:MAG: hypothetical protein UX47_C0004G0059 [Candidatus Collierbacteria bacterium GW2011_GWA2_46_26]OGD73505.1 MAG: hypothetical protein A3K29_05275 [Candidatus Collierbacteria bacterium RIFOXYB2_FULL_46_14]OGD76547.1 MAG: hypothetical protein A3K43_05275 [Candidatus Collierbacteria bacterium RIFOXYA2_FULL_46_20]OGD77883.1 MAG: hypothetical protein A3K39_05275 [Candidatus Collierbacteria bacterium RIFOXYC2_FULL_43_15]OGD81173.1 MAG: hypothetical protein A2320_05770 [Pseudomonadales bacterium G